jgi:hypothetical protein
MSVYFAITHVMIAVRFQNRISTSSHEATRQTIQTAKIALECYGAIGDIRKGKLAGCLVGCVFVLVGEN